MSDEEPFTGCLVSRSDLDHGFYDEPWGGLRATVDGGGLCLVSEQGARDLLAERDRLRAENERLRQELHEPDSPEGEAYKSEVTRLEGEIAVLQASNRDYLLELEDARNETSAVEYLRKETIAERDAVRIRMGRLRKRLEIISESRCAFQPERHPGCICDSCTARRELEEDGGELEGV